MSHKLWLIFLTQFSPWLWLFILFPNQHSVVYLAARAWKALRIVALENHFWPNLSQLDLTMGQKLSDRLQIVISKLILPDSRLYLTKLAVSSEDKRRILIAKNHIQTVILKILLFLVKNNTGWTFEILHQATGNLQGEGIVMLFSWHFV